MKRILFSTALVLSLGIAPQANADNAQFDRSIQNALENYGFEVDAASLTPHQKTQIHFIETGSTYTRHKRLRIKTVLEGSILNRLFN